MVASTHKDLYGATKIWGPSHVDACIVRRPTDLDEHFLACDADCFASLSVLVHILIPEDSDGCPR